MYGKKEKIHLTLRGVMKRRREKERGKEEKREGGREGKRVRESMSTDAGGTELRIHL